MKFRLKYEQIYKEKARLFHRKLNAFSLPELMMAMMLSLFLMGILFLSYQIMSRQMYYEENNNYSNFLRVKSIIEMELFKADYAISSENNLELLSDTSRVSLNFSDNVILRKSYFVTDTIFTGQYYYHASASNERLLALRLVFITEADSIPVHFEKKYYSAQILKRKDIRFEY